MNVLNVTDVAINLRKGQTPFLPERNAVAHNTSAGSITLQGSDDGAAYTTLATVPAAGAVAIKSLPNYIKLSAAGTLPLLGGA